MDSQKTEQLSHITIEQAPEGVAWIDEEGRFHRVNDAFCEITGYGNDELLSEIRVDTLDPNFPRKEFAKLYANADPHASLTLESEIVCKNGQEKPIEIRMNFILFEGEKYSCTFVTDISDRKKAEKEQQDTYRQLKELKNQLVKENYYLQEEIKLEHNFSEIVGNSHEFRRTLLDVEKVARTDSTVLILGETGTGKELIARAIHNLSERRDRPLVKINCAALPTNLIESELFGHEKGAFTGAHTTKIGRFELADRGTIFLDEIGELQMEVQVKLLRILQESEFERLGGTVTKKVDVRIITATNRDLETLITENRFREDLYYRLNVFPVLMPPLRKRKEDIPILVNYFIQKLEHKTGKKIESVPQKVMDKFVKYSWPGNVRELENILERAMVISSGKTLVVGNWLTRSTPETTEDEIISLKDNERDHIQKALQQTDWRVSGDHGAARLLNVNPHTLFSKIKKLNIKR